MSDDDLKQFIVAALGYEPISYGGEEIILSLVDIRKIIAADRAKREPVQRCQCCGYLVTESEHRGCLRAALPVQQAPVDAVHQWRKRTPDHPWHDAPRDEAYARTDEFYEARTLYAAPQEQVRVPDAKPLAHGHREDYYLLANARRIVKREYQRSPNWVIASALFATGSSSAWQICNDAGIDPDALKVTRRSAAAPTPPVQQKPDNFDDLFDAAVSRLIANPDLLIPFYPPAPTPPGEPKP